MPTSKPRKPQVLHWIHPEKRRWYTVIATPDLFGDLVLIRAWGSLDSRQGGEMREILDSAAEIEKRLHAIARQRRRHGYVICGEPPWNLRTFCGESNHAPDRRSP